MANPIKIQGEVTNIVEYDKGIFSLVIQPEKRLPRFKAGQFLHLTIDEFDPCGGFWPESRVFSIASASGCDVLEIVYSVKGRYTSRMADELKLGKRVWIKIPYGDFSVETSVGNEENIIMVAGGTGVSPYISYLQELFSGMQPNKRRVHVVYGIRNERHLLFENVISKCCNNQLGISIDLFIESQENTLGTVGIVPKSGMITIEHLVECGKILDTPVYFLSGPPQMIKTFSTGLQNNGIGQNRIKIDAWE